MSRRHIDQEALDFSSGYRLEVFADVSDVPSINELLRFNIRPMDLNEVTQIPES